MKKKCIKKIKDLKACEISKKETKTIKGGIDTNDQALWVAIRK